MKKVNYKGVELEVHDSSIVRTYNRASECQIEFKTAYVLDGLTFLSLEEVDKYLERQYKVAEYKGIPIYRILYTNRNSVEYKSKCLTYTCNSIDEVIAGIDIHLLERDGILNFLKKETVFDFQNIKPESKMKIENDIPNPLSVSDNRLAIRMLNSVSEIISEIENRHALS